MVQRNPTGDEGHEPKRPRRDGLEDTLLRETIGDEASHSRVEDIEALPRGAMVGRYVVLEHIGAGGMGVVYAAYDPDLDRRVALKVLRATLDDESEGDVARARLLREGRAMASVHHTNIIAVHDVGTHEQRVFIAMEFIDGYTLTDWLLLTRRSRAEVLGVFRAAGEGLAAAHRQGLIHRDFKPDNVLIGHDGRVAVVDFGLARRDELASHGNDLDLASIATESSGGHDAEPESLGSRANEPAMTITRTGMLLGTPAYMAPEQHLGLHPSAAADQFAFCVGLYEALYGERPFCGDNPAELLVNVTESDVRPPPDNARVPGWIRRVLLRGLGRRPRERWPDMEALLEALHHPPHARRRRWAAAAIGVLAVGGGSAGLWAATQTDQRRCDASVQQWHELWDDTTQQHAARAFEATNKGFAADAWRVVQRDAQAHVQTWTAAQVDACAATHLRDEQSPEVLELREACFEGARQRFATLTELWTDADDEIVAGAVDAVRSLPAPPTCMASVVLRSEARLPRDPAVRAEVAAQRRALDRVSVLGHANRLDVARTLASEVLARAQTLGVMSLEAEALLARADLEEAVGQLDDAQASTHAALLLAERNDDDRLAAIAWIDLLWIDGYRRARHDAGHAAADHARALLHRGPDTENLAILLESRLGDLLYTEGRYFEALDRHRIALDLRLEAGPDDDPRLGDSLTGMGLCELELGRYDDALEHLQTARRLYRETYGPRHPQTAAALTNLGIAYDFRGELAEALHHHEQARVVSELAHGASHTSVAEVLNNYGSVLVAMERYEDAEAAFVRARDILSQHYDAEHPDLAMVAFNLGQVADGRGQPSRSRSLHRHALTIRVRTLGQDHPDIATSLQALAELDIAEGKHAEARRRLERALEIRMQAFGEDSEDALEIRRQLESVPADAEPG